MALKGKIYKGIGGFYYVHTPEGDYEYLPKPEREAARR